MIKDFSNSILFGQLIINLLCIFFLPFTPLMGNIASQLITGDSMNLIGSQEYDQYRLNLEELKLVNKIMKKGELERLSSINGRLIKKERLEFKSTISTEELLKNLETLEIPKKIAYINSMHLKLCDGRLVGTDNAELTHSKYNTSLKLMQKWNERFGVINKDLHILPIQIKSSSSSIDLSSISIDLPSMKIPEKSTKLNPFSEITVNFSDKSVREQAIDDYLALLEKCPWIKREGDNNDHTKGAYENCYNKEEILKTQQKIYDEVYSKEVKTKSPREAHEIASEKSFFGVVYKGPFSVIFNDLVTNPNKIKHGYIRYHWKTELNNKYGITGAAVLPVTVTEEGLKKFGVILIFRHATGRWHIEAPRGGSKPNETLEMIAEREAKEETGFKVKKCELLGKMTPDSGILASTIPVLRSEIDSEGNPEFDKNEAIGGKYFFSYKQLHDGFKKGYLEVQCKGETIKADCSDAVLAYGLLLEGE